MSYYFVKQQFILKLCFLWFFPLATRGSAGSGRRCHEANAAAILVGPWRHSGLWKSAVPLDPRVGPGRDYCPRSGSPYRLGAFASGVQRSCTCSQHQLRVHQGVGSAHAAADHLPCACLRHERPDGLREGRDSDSRPEGRTREDFRVWLPVPVPWSDLSSETNHWKLTEKTFTLTQGESVLICLQIKVLVCTFQPRLQWTRLMKHNFTDFLCELNCVVINL